MATESTALIVGASRGLGLALVEEWLKRDTRVIATQHGPSRNLAALQRRYPGSLATETVDIADAASVRALRERLGNRQIGVLFINAGICKANEETPSTAAEQEFVDMMLTNALGPMRAVELLECLVPPGRRDCGHEFGAGAASPVIRAFGSSTAPAKPP